MTARWDRRSALTALGSLLFFGQTTHVVGSPQELSKSDQLSAREFGVVADAGENGSGTDNWHALQTFFNVLATGSFKHATVPPGRYSVSAPISLISDALRDLELHCKGVEFVFTSPHPAKGRAYVAIVSPAQSGRLLKIDGLIARLSRPTVRISDSDMVRLYGFREYVIDTISVPSSDNMGITIGRGGTKGGYYMPDSIIVRDCHVGGRREGIPHSHASIGDTGIWIVTPAIENLIVGCRVRETGDDGIYVGHSASRAIHRVAIRDNVIRESGARGIGVAVPGVEITGNTIERTNSSGILCESMDGGDASGAKIANNVIRNAGHLEAGEIGIGMIPKHHPHGIFIYQPGGHIVVAENTIDAPRQCGLCIHSHPKGDFSTLELLGGEFSRVGLDHPGRAAVFRRSGSAMSSVSNFVARNTRVSQTQQPLLDWHSSSDENDQSIVIENIELSDCNLPESIPLIRLGHRNSGKPVGVRASVTLAGSHVIASLEAPHSIRNIGVPITIRKR